MDMKLEVLVTPISDVDRAKAFYEKLRFRLDIDYVANENYRVIQFTPPGSDASIIFGKGITSAQPGSIDRLVLAVSDIAAIRDELVSQGIKVSEIFHDAGGGLAGGFHAGTEGRAPPVQIPKVVPTARMPLSAIPTATVGCSRRSRRGCSAGSTARR
jgi:predicted enzyme related to lactoylglutathione lyase